MLRLGTAAIATALVGTLLAGGAVNSALVAQDLPGGVEPLPPLTWDEVEAGLLRAYPPLLIAELERAVAEGRLREATSIFDLDLFAKTGGVTDGYYEYTTTEAGLEQFTGIWGSTIYGGYRLTTGEELPDYYRNRTFEDGEVALGLRIPLLKDGPIDPLRAELERTEIAFEAVPPFIARQRLDVVQAANIAYHSWVAAGRRLELARELLQLALDRQEGLEQQVESGFRPGIDLTDNQQLVVSRQLEVSQAEAAFRIAAVALSLFLFDMGPDQEPLIPGEERLPPGLDIPDIAMPDLEAGLARAATTRPELAVLALGVAREEVGRRLANASALPTLDASLEFTRDFGAELYADLARDELTAAVQFKLPIQRRAETGKQLQAETKLEAARTKLEFGREKVFADVRKAAADLAAALEQVEFAEQASELAEQLRVAEAELFAAGASDLLALQLREQSAFNAIIKLVDTRLKLLVSLAKWRAAIAEGVDLDPAN